MKTLLECIKHLPNDLQNFELDLSVNEMGGDVENMKFLVEGIK